MLNLWLILAGSRAGLNLGGFVSAWDQGSHLPGR
jgi:hypothetical protein